MSSHHNDEEKSDDGSVWTSYSDLFTTVAVIFLVMFVFALLRSGINTAKAIKEKKAQQEILEGKIPEKVAVENQNKKDSLNKSITEMNQFNQVIDNKMLEINSFQDKMKKHQNVMVDLLKDQEIKETVMKELRVKLDAKELELEKTSEKIVDINKHLDLKVAALSEKMKKNEELEQKRDSLKKVIEEKEQHVVKLQESHENKIIEKNQEITTLQEEVIKKDNSNTELDQKITELNIVKDKKQEMITSLKTNVSTLENNLETKKLELVNLDKKIESEKQITELKSKNIENLQKKLSVEFETNHKLEKKVTKLSEVLNTKKEEVTKASNDISHLEKTILSKDQSIKNLDKELVSLQDTYKKSVTKNQELNKKSIDLKTKLTDTNERLIEEQNQRSKIEADYHTAVQKTQEMSQNIDNMAANVDGLQKQITEKEKLALMLKSELSQSMVKNGKASAHNQALDGEISELKSKVVDLKQNIGDEKIQKQNLNKNIADLKSQFSESQNQKSDLENEAKGLKNQIAALNDSLDQRNQNQKTLEQGLASLQESLKTKDGEKAELSNQIKGLESKMAGLNDHLTGQTKNANDLSKKLSDMHENFLQGNNKIGELKHKMGQKDAKIGDLNNKIEGMKNQIAASSNAGEKIKNNYNKVAQNYSDSLQKSQAQEQELSKLNQKVRQLYGKIQDLKVIPVQEKNPKLEEELSLLARQNQNLKDQIKKNENESIKKAKDAGRKIASVQSSLRAHIGKKIAARLNAANLNVFVDPSTGAVILRMDNSFLFKINSAELSNGLKTTLKKVIPLYVDELFKDKDVSNKISHINIIGHASPRHRQKYVDPLGNNIRAYNFNLDLSSDRARSIVKYIFGNKFNPFNFQPQFRQKVQAIGKSFSEPVLRRPSSVKSSKINCGIYDCKLSRRVEISFTLKDNKEVWENK